MTVSPLPQRPEFLSWSDIDRLIDYAAITDRFIVYPWEVQRGPDALRAEAPQPN